MKHAPSKYILIDRDGTVIVNKHYQKDPAITELEKNACEGVTLLHEAGFGLILITNQSGIGRGKLTREDMDAVNRRMVELLGGGEDLFAGMYFCPHVPDDNCECRKPGTGLLRRAAEELGFSLDEAYMIGDRDIDVLCGKAAGTTTVLVRTGYGTEEERKDGVKADYVAGDLVEAAEWIIRREGGGQKNT